MGNNTLTLEIIKETFNKLHESYKKGIKNGYTYILPSPNEEKRLIIRGWLGPGEAAQIAKEIWVGEKTVNDYECVEEIDDILTFKEKLFSKRYKHDFRR